MITLVLLLVALAPAIGLVLVPPDDLGYGERRRQLIARASVKP